MNITELLSNPSMLHAAAVHMPIAAAVFGLLLIVLSAIFHRNNSIRAVTLLMFAILVVSAKVGIETGERARDLVPNTLSSAIWDQLTAHAASAERVFYAGLVALIFVAISLIRVDFLRVAGLIFAAVAAIVVNVFVAQTGHMGGALVYNEGVGTPLLHQAAQPTTEEHVMPADEGTAPEAAPAESEDLVPIRDFTMEEAKQVSYIRDIWPIIDDECIVCHEPPDNDGEYLMTTVENMMKGGEKGGPGVVPGKPDESAIIGYIRGKFNPRMPEDEPPLSEDSLHLLRMWIAAGAIDDSPAAEAPTPEPAPVPEAAPAAEKVTEEAPAPAPPAEAPVPEAVPAPAPVPAPEAAPAPEPAPVPEAAPAAEEMKEEAPAPPSEAPVPEAVPAPAPVPAPEAAPAPEPAPVPEAAPAAEEVKEEGPAEAPVPAAGPAPAHTP
ncbi:MAG: hypothetical protein L3K26_19020, partial [Candidatus Hydrogenedentes bacterium]|nr:hypothetical protein [Candidatus Hydrogenedentota bacterium]